MLTQTIFLRLFLFGNENCLRCLLWLVDYICSEGIFKYFLNFVRVKGEADMLQFVWKYIF